MRRLYLTVLRGLSINFLSTLGSAMCTSAFVLFLVIDLLHTSGMLTNAYIGLISYLALPALFVLGLILIPVGWFVQKSRTGIPLRNLLNYRFSEDDVKAKEAGSKVIRAIAGLTVLNLVFLGFATTQMLHFMDSATFCGTACHKVMNPEWVTYQQSPHARVQCVECHVGEGVDALIESKINGAWQVISASFDLYERPIPTPVHTLRPARETCEKCHWPSKFHGNRIKNIVNYKMDSLSTPVYTTLVLKVGTGERSREQGSHWHISEDNLIRYTSVDDEREEIIRVEAKQPDGSFKTFLNTRLNDKQHETPENVRTMDCVDCHNRATHIYEEPEAAVNERMTQGLIDRSLPYIKERAYGALTNNYPDKETAMQRIGSYIGNYYRAKYPTLTSQKSKQIDQSIQTVQDIYSRNIHHRMNIKWNAYEPHIGHHRGGGCFRCHNEYMKDETGQTISMDCTLCHSFFAYEDSEPFEFISSQEGDPRELKLKRYLRGELDGQEKLK